MIYIKAYTKTHSFNFTADDRFNENQDAKIFDTLSKSDFNHVCMIAQAEFDRVVHVDAIAATIDKDGEVSEGIIFSRTLNV